MTTQKKVLGTYSAGSNHWVGDGFPVRNLFPSNGVEVSPFLMLDYAGPSRFEPSKKQRGVGEHGPIETNKDMPDRAGVGLWR